MVFFRIFFLNKGRGVSGRFGQAKHCKKRFPSPFHLDILKAESVAVPTVPVLKNFNVEKYHNFLRGNPYELGRRPL